MELFSQNYNFLNLIDLKLHAHGFNQIQRPKNLVKFAF